MVDPVKRATIQDIYALEWFAKDLPDYLRPLPLSASLEDASFNFERTGESSSEEAEVSEDDEEDSDSDVLSGSESDQTVASHELKVDPTVCDLRDHTETIDTPTLEQLCNKFKCEAEEVVEKLGAKGDNEVKAEFLRLKALQNIAGLQASYIEDNAADAQVSNLSQSSGFDKKAYDRCAWSYGPSNQ